MYEAKPDIFQRNLRRFEIGGNLPYECLNVFLKRTSILRENQGESWPNLCNFSDFQTFSKALIFFVLAS